MIGKLLILLIESVFLLTIMLKLHLLGLLDYNMNIMFLFLHFTFVMFLIYYKRKKNTKQSILNSYLIAMEENRDDNLYVW